MAGINSLPMMVIALLKRHSDQGPWTPAEAAALISGLMPTLVARLRLSPEGTEKYIAKRLEELADLGLVQGSPDKGYVLTWGGDPPDPPVEVNEGDTRPPEPPNINGAGGGGGGGDEGPGTGIREVLVHPTLFALSDEDFEELVTNMWGEQNG